MEILFIYIAVSLFYVFGLINMERKDYDIALSDLLIMVAASFTIGHILFPIWIAQDLGNRRFVHKLFNTVIIKRKTTKGQTNA